METALGASSHKDELTDMITRGVGVVAGRRACGTTPRAAAAGARR